LTKKEALFLAFAWIPKTTVQAAVSGVVLNQAMIAFSMTVEQRALYEEYGREFLTIAILAILITAPTGAIVINSTGNKWLTYDKEVTDLED